VKIGPYNIGSKAWLAPMAGVTDRPFRQLCRRLGAGLAVSEMTSANPLLRQTVKSQRRLDHRGEPGPRAVQIAGTDPAMLADFARYNVDLGAQIIDINMGCPAKKVCNLAAGSALLRDEALVAAILDAVVAAVDVPVTLKIRTGWDPAHRNGLRIARIAEAAGIQALAVHGRTRACGYSGEAEFNTIRDIKAAISIPVIANGDIRDAARARAVLSATGADAVMIGRGAQGNPWIFREINHYLDTGVPIARPGSAELAATLVGHLHELHEFYGKAAGVRVARKHLGWYLRSLPGGEGFWQRVNRVESTELQIEIVHAYFSGVDRRLAA
jgi:tRNA-dihydrouridine synthase B